MNTIYSLRNGIIFNPTGKKHNAIANPAALKEITQHKDYFSFDFINLFKAFTIYKICKEGDEDIIQGLVAFKASIGIIQCANMELNSINQKPLLLHSGLGKCMVALCCKISFDMGFEGFITFEAKNRLMPYYRRMGAINVSGLIMAVETPEAQKLVDVFF
jgi:hypothetical protein